MQSQGGTHDASSLGGDDPGAGLLFARSMESGTLVSVQDVARGLACQCECPECGRRLIARQGEKTVWHFAHQVWDGDGVVTPCKFGLYSSLRAMAIQALSIGGNLLLPQISAERSIQTVRSGVLAERMVFRETKHIDTGLPITDDRWQAQVGDLCFATQGYTLSVVFLYPGRSTMALMDTEGYGITHCVLGIAIGNDSAPAAAMADKRVFEAQIREGPLPRHWLYHPNQVCCEHELDRRIRMRLRDTRDGHHHAWCQRCDAQWLGNGAVADCRQCGAQERTALMCR